MDYLKRIQDRHQEPAVPRWLRAAWDAVDCSAATNAGDTCDEEDDVDPLEVAVSNVLTVLDTLEAIEPITRKQSDALLKNHLGTLLASALGSAEAGAARRKERKGGR